MIALGTRTCAYLFATCALTYVAYSQGVLGPRYFLSLHPFAIFVIGFLATCACAVIMSFFGSPRSEHHIALGRGAHKGDIFLFAIRDHSIKLSTSSKNRVLEFPKLIQWAFLWLVLMMLMILIVDNRFLVLIESSLSNPSLARVRFCPENETLPVVTEPKKLGCELVRRAHQLGFVEDLGDCAEKKVPVFEVCNLRQHDEPYLHYLWRVAAVLFTDLRRHTSGPYVYNSELIFREKVKSIHTLFETNRQTIQAEPRSSHHVWTNLKEDGGMSLWESLNPSSCLKEADGVTPYIANSQKNTSIRNAYLQLLFNSRRESATGFCKEYKIHWNTNIDFCKQLAKDPSKTLAAAGLHREVSQLLSRLKTAQAQNALDVQVEALHKRMSPLKSNASLGENLKNGSNTIGEKQTDLPLPSRLTSFSCLWALDSKHRRNDVITPEERPFEFEGAKLSLVEVSLSQKMLESNALIDAVPVNSYKGLAKLLAPQFHYGDFSSNEPVSTRAQRAAAHGSLRGTDFRLTRLENLKLLDVFNDDEWAKSHSDLMPLYPFYLHLHHYVSLFRAEYKLHKGRL